MALATRVIPTLLARGHNLVKGKRFNSWRTVGHVTQSVRIHQSRGVDELLILDICATPEGRSPDYDFIQRLTDECFMPVTYGGGIRSVDDVRRVLKSGADKVCIGTGAYEVDWLVKKAADEFGSQAIVVSLDVGFGGTVMVGCGKSPWSDDVLYCADWAERSGAGEILLQNVDRDGTMEGYNLVLIEMVSNAVGIPVVASGGCSGYEDMVDAVQAGASAVAAGALFQFTSSTPLGASMYLQAKGIEARIEERA